MKLWNLECPTEIGIVHHTLSTWTMKDDRWRLGVDKNGEIWLVQYGFWISPFDPKWRQSDQNNVIQWQIP
jgi:hypothetical protein